MPLVRYVANPDRRDGTREIFLPADDDRDEVRLVLGGEAQEITDDEYRHLSQRRVLEVVEGKEAKQIKEERKQAEKEEAEARKQAELAAEQAGSGVQTAGGAKA